MENQKVTTNEELAQMINTGFEHARKERRELLEHIKGVDDRVSSVQEGMVKVSDFLALERRMQVVEKQLDIEPS